MRSVNRQVKWDTFLYFHKERGGDVVRERVVDSE
jgi:hypothetical protein